MKRLMCVASFALAPSVSLADDPEPSFDAVDVEYWGRLETCSYGDCGDLPDVLYDKLTINVSLAPPDLFPDNPLTGDYGPMRGSVLSNFVTTPSQTLGGRPRDFVVVNTFTGAALPNHGSVETYTVSNASSIVKDGEEVAEQRVQVGLSAPRDWGIEGDGILQQFDVRTADVGGDGRGVVTQLLNGVRIGYSFIVDRFRATPRVCRP